MSEHEPQTFIRKYIFSLDHKVIGIQYIIAAFVMAIVGGGLTATALLSFGWDELAQSIEMTRLFGAKGGGAAKLTRLGLDVAHWISVQPEPLLLACGIALLVCTDLIRRSTKNRSKRDFISKSRLKLSHWRDSQEAGNARNLRGFSTVGEVGPGR